MNAALVLAGLCLAAAVQTEDIGSISGVVVNGSQHETALPNAEVVLRVIEDGAPVPIAQTTTNESGEFTFDNLPVDPGLLYVAGANLEGVHYPGARVRLTAAEQMAQVKLVAFQTVAEPSPLISKKVELMVQTTDGVLEITESMLVENPTHSTYVGKKTRSTAPVTLRLSLPPDFESVTFHDEFHGRSFFVLDGRLMTDIPWPPGARQIKYTYRLPIEHRGRTLARSLDLPCSDVTVRVMGEKVEDASCNLPTAAKSAHEICFRHSGSLLPTGHQLLIQLERLPVPVMAYARWFALGILLILIAGTIPFMRQRARTGNNSSVKRAVPHKATRRPAA